MITAFKTPALSIALEQLKNLVAKNEENGKQTVIFCEDRLTLAAERTVCNAVGGTFLTSVYTFARFLSSENGKVDNVLSAQASAMAIRKIIDDNRDKLQLFKKLSTVTASQDVYDTIALLYSSRVTPEDLLAVNSTNVLLNKKLHDLQLLYSEYSSYLLQNDCIDRNAYLRMLPSVIENSQKIKDADVVFLGFQAFTCSVAECATACMATAKNVYGIFIGGVEEIYTNEALASFSGRAKAFGGVNLIDVPSNLCAEAEHLRKHLFNAESFYLSSPLSTSNVTAYEAVDMEDELEYVCANIIKHVQDDGIRYQSISVMLPDVNAYQATLEQVFGDFEIPYYIDKRYSLSEHPLCSFIINYLNCVADGCLPDSVISVATSPIFDLDRKHKDVFVNYVLKFAAYRGGVKREPNKEILQNAKFNYDWVQTVRQPFIKYLSMFPQKARGEEYCSAIKSVLNDIGAKTTIEKLSQSVKDSYPTLSKFSERVLSSLESVLNEAEKITHGISLPVREFQKILKSGLTAAQVSLIPPKADAVFVGSIAQTANVGSKVIFAVGLTDAVPGSSQDTAILTDRELTSLENLSVIISPKIAQVNKRVKEMCALNLCAFKQKLYLSYPVGGGDGESRESEIITYYKHLFRSKNGEKAPIVNRRKLLRSKRAIPYFSARPMPAIRQMLTDGYDTQTVSAIYSVLSDNGYGDVANSAIVKPQAPSFTQGKALFGNYVSPTTLETYFSCPYKNFLKQGVGVQEREEGAIRALDIGNFIHGILQDCGKLLKEQPSKEQLLSFVSTRAEELLQTPQYASFISSKRGKYTTNSLVKEAQEIALGMYEQLQNSKFDVSDVERKCEIIFDNGVKMSGRIDRVDRFNDMVRIVDYKTGGIDDEPKSYYMGLKLQLPLYLTSISKDARPVGAYYFPANIDYRKEENGVYRLQGFMDISDEVVLASDTTLEKGNKSKYVSAKLGSKPSGGGMAPEDFGAFLQYGSLVAKQGVNEMMAGNVAPSPTGKACEYCKFGGNCGFDRSVSELRPEENAKCTAIANLVKKIKGDI